MLTFTFRFFLGPISSFITKSDHLPTSSISLVAFVRHNFPPPEFSSYNVTIFQRVGFITVTVA